MFLWMMDDETYRRRREAFVRADHSGYAPVTGQADPKAQEPASFDTKSHVDDRQTRCQEDWGDVHYNPNPIVTADSRSDTGNLGRINGK
jgi:hypothetical protein